MKALTLVAVLALAAATVWGLKGPQPSVDSALTPVVLASHTERPAANRPARTATTVNSVLGDQSFIAAFGRRPGAGDGEDLRLRTHLAYVEALLRVRDVSALSPELQAARTRNLDRLREYRTAGVFPRNTVRARERTPVFIDSAGRICAVGYLMEQDLGRSAADAINARYQTATLFEIDATVLAKWLATSGFTLEEAAMIQPAYGPYGDVYYQFDTTGPTVCGSNENPSPSTMGTPQVMGTDMERGDGLTCEDAIDDVYGTSGFTSVFDPARSIRFATIYSETSERPDYASISFKIWRTAAGPSSVRLLTSTDGGASFRVRGEYEVTTTPTPESNFFGFPAATPLGSDVIFAFEARGDDPSGTLFLEDIYSSTFYTPVELTSFKGATDGSDAHLTWETASETNNAGFEVQMRRPGQDGFEALGLVDGHGTTTEAQRYAYAVRGLEPGTHAFRLKQIDFDGQFEYHGDVEVTVAVPDGFALGAIYPNPFNPQARFTLDVAHTQPVRVSLYDALGRRVADVFSGVLEGGQRHDFTLDGSQLASGLLVLRAVGTTFSASQNVTLLR